MDKNSIIKGLQVGSLITGMRRVENIPIAYLYNGVRLPPLPEWDREKYPYAHIGTFELVGTDWAALYASQYPFFVDSNGKFKLSGGVLLSTSILVSSSSWGTLSINEDWDCENSSAHPAVWANYDMTYYDDGTLFLAASDPIPVYE